MTATESDKVGMSRFLKPPQTARHELNINRRVSPVQSTDGDYPGWPLPSFVSTQVSAQRTVANLGHLAPCILRSKSFGGAHFGLGRFLFAVSRCRACFERTQKLRRNFRHLLDCG